MTRANLSRRQFLKMAGISSATAALGTVAAACQPQAPTTPEAPAGATSAPQAPAKKLQVYWHDWTPTQSMERSEDNPLPHNKILEVVEGWRADHPNVEVEWLQLPQVDFNLREWTIAQQEGGTIPHIVPAQHWRIKDDVDKNWWVDLTPYLQQPNPYIPAGEPGSEKWLDQLYPLPTGDTIIQGKHFNLPLGIVTTFFFYNKTMFDERGLSVPTSFAEFLEVCQAFQDEGIISYAGWTGPPEDTDHWYRLQMGGMIMQRDIEPLVNPAGGIASAEAVGCAIQNGVYTPHLDQYREWMELWKQTVPFRPQDWTIQSPDDSRLWLTKQASMMENATWAFPRVLNDSQVDFEWSTFYAPPLTQASTQFVADPPPTPWPIGGAVSDQFGITTRAEKDGVLEEALDLMRWIMVPANLQTIQGEIGTIIPNVKGVTVNERLEEPHRLVTEAIGEQQMFVYELNKMDAEAATSIGNAWRSYMLDQTDLDQAIDEIDAAFTGYSGRFAEQGVDCA